MSVGQSRKPMGDQSLSALRPPSMDCGSRKERKFKGLSIYPTEMESSKRDHLNWKTLEPHELANWVSFLLPRSGGGGKDSSGKLQELEKHRCLALFLECVHLLPRLG